MDNKTIEDRIMGTTVPGHVRLLSRYSMVVLGSCLLMIAGAMFSPLGPGYGTAGRGLATFIAGITSLGPLFGAPG